MDKRNLAVVGSGPAGLTSAIYASRYELSTLVLGEEPGGTITDAHKVCNYPGMPEIKGRNLAEKIKDHAKKYGAELKIEKVVEAQKKENEFSLKTNLNNKYLADNLVLATGTRRRRLNLKRENEFLGNGVSYCATCDGRFFKNDKVGVVGGGNAAATAGLYLSDLAEKVYIIYRGKKLKATPAWKKEIKNTENIEVIYETEVKKLKGNDNLEAVELTEEFEGSDNLEIDGLFIEIGSVPITGLAEDLGVELDEKGYIKVEENQRTNVSSLWAVGDVTDNSNYFQQAVVSSAEGAVAAGDIYKSIKSSS